MGARRPGWLCARGGVAPERHARARFMNASLGGPARGRGLFSGPALGGKERAPPPRPRPRARPRVREPRASQPHARLPPPPHLGPADVWRLGAAARYVRGPSARSSAVRALRTGMQGEKSRARARARAGQQASTSARSFCKCVRVCVRVCARQPFPACASVCLSVCVRPAADRERGRANWAQRIIHTGSKLPSSLLNISQTSHSECGQTHPA